MNSKKKEYIIAGGILLIGFIASALILFFPHQTQKDKVSEKGNENVEYQVTFHKADGEILETRTVLSGNPVLPPDLEKSADYFKGWDQELYCISEDMDVYPIIEDISQIKNAVFADAVYTETGEEFSVLLRIGGDVFCTGFTIEGAYDTNLLTYCGEGETADGITIQHDKKSGKITVVKEEDTTLKESITIAELRFCCREEGCYQTNFPLLTKEIDAEGNYTDSTAYDCAIHLYDLKEKE